MSPKEYEDFIWLLANQCIELMQTREKSLTPAIALDVLAIAYLGLVRNNPGLRSVARDQLNEVAKLCSQTPIDEPITHPTSPIH